MGIQKLSVIVPIFNEVGTALKIVEAIRSVSVPKEIIIVDDGSTDGTRELLERNVVGHEGCVVLFHEKNRGKGAAIRTGIRAVSGDKVIIQDADLEYDPQDYFKLINEMTKRGAGVVYGSRFLSGKKVTAFWHRVVNSFLTAFANLLYTTRLTDMETCYKLFRSEILKKMEITSNGFEIEVELTAKVLKKGERIYEVPISYKGRSFHEGKKIGWKDGVKAFWAILHYRFLP